MNNNLPLMKYVKGLDTVRAFAILIVIIAHWGPHKFKSAPLTFVFSKLIPEGMFGVDLFFVLSGYLITRILLTARNEATTEERLAIIKNFYIRRALRIFPIYFFYVLIVAYVCNDSYIKDNIFYFLTYTSNLPAFWSGKAYVPHTWSLAVEEQFYIIWPWIIIYTPKKYLMAVILIFMGIGMASTQLLYHFYGVYSAYLLLPCITAFSTGALFACVQLQPRNYKVVVNTFKWLLPLSMILLYAHQFGMPLVLIRAVNSVIAVTVIIYISKQNFNRVSSFIFNNKLLAKIGKISYGLYLYHYQLPQYYYIFISYLKQHFTLNTRLLSFLTVPPPAYLIHLSLLAFISILSYRYIELPFLKLKKYFNYINGKQVLPQHADLIK